MNYFKNKNMKNETENTTEVDIFQGKSDNEIVEMIHNEFDTAVDDIKSMLAVAEPSKITEKDRALIDKSNRLKCLGFTNSVVVGESEEKRWESELEKRKEDSRVSTLEAIRHFSLHYPQNKFITQEGVDAICEKYGLIYSEVANFIGDVPEKNIQDIENFKVRKEDCLYSSDSYSFVLSFSFNELNDREDHIYDEHSNSFTLESDERWDVFKSDSLEIVAPPKDFKKDGFRMEGNKLVREIKDPVVLQPVFFNRKKHYIIVTAWGIEAQDDLVFNEGMN